MSIKLSFLKLDAFLSLVVCIVLIVAKLLLRAKALHGFVAEDTQYRLGNLMEIFQTIDIISIFIVGQLSFVFVLSIIFVSFRLLSFIWNSASSLPLASEISAIHKLIAAAITILLFNHTITSILLTSYSTLSDIFEGSLNSISQYVDSGFQCVQGYSPLDPSLGLSNQCFTQSLSAGINSMSRSISDLGSIILNRSVSITSAVVAVIFYVVTALGLSRVNGELKPAQKFWLGYGFVTIFALYLTMSSILAVPLLTHIDAEANVKPEELKSKLESMVPAAWKLDKKDEIEKAQDLRDKRLSETLPSGDAEWQVTSDSVQISDLKEQLGKTEGSMQELEKAGFRHTQQINDFVYSQLGAAWDNYLLETNVRKGQRESIQHFLSIRAWFQFVVNDAISEASRCQVDMDRASGEYSRLVEAINDVVVGSKATRLSPTSIVYSFGPEAIHDANTAIERASETCDISYSTNFTPPERQDFGSSLGIAGAATSWLLSSESIQVALITGLIGFGLLGSLVARFVSLGSQQLQANVGEHIIDGGNPNARNNVVSEFKLEEIGTVIFSGFCAAIIVYVASYGGLAIFASSDSDPNPYVVFGGCLIAAVYSKVVWERARDAFLPKN